MSKPTCTLAIDIGTTNAKAVTLDDATGNEVSSARCAVRLHTDESGAAEQDAHDVDAAVREVVGRAVAATDLAGFAIARVGFSAAMHSILPIGRDEMPCGPALIWMDTRANAAADSLWRSAEGPEIYARTGAPVHAMTPLAKLIWLRERRSDVFGAAARFVSLKEWVWQRWFGEWCVDWSIAGATGLCNLETCDWDPRALATAGIGPERLSRVVPTTYVRRATRGDVVVSLGLDADTPCNIGSSDGVLANLGVGATGPGALVMTIGTSLAVRFTSSRPILDAASRSFCYPLRADSFVVGGASNSGGIVLDWLHGKVLTAAGGAADNDGIGALVAQAADVDSGSLICVPHIVGERAPVWNADVRAAFAGVDVNHTRVHLVRAALEGIIMNARWVVAGLLEASERPGRLIVTGRPFETAWVRQVAADVFDLPIHQFTGGDPALAGAAQLARIATGATSWDEAARAGRQSDRPAAYPVRSKAYQARYEAFRRLAALTTAPDGTFSMRSPLTTEPKA
jgi:gluconokinase